MAKVPFGKRESGSLARGNAMTLGYDSLGGGVKSDGQKNQAIKGKST